MLHHWHRSRAVRCLSILTLALLASRLARAQSDASYSDQKQRLADLHIRPLLEKWPERSGAPGGVIALVERDQILILEGFGFSNAARRAPVDPNTTLFQVGDLVRPITTTAILRLVEQGRLTLDEDLSGRRDLQFLDLGSHGALTTEQLLLHTAGFDRRVIASRATSAEDVQPLKAYLERRMPARTRIPGQISIPSSHGYSLAGLIVEGETGQTFHRSLDELVFRPFDMSSSTVAPHTPSGAAVATGYRRLVDQLSEVAPDYPHTIPASFFLTTAEDMALWLRAVLNDGRLDGRDLLGSDSIDRLLNQQFRHHASLPGRTLAFREGSQFSPPELYLASQDSGFSSVLLLLPARRVGLFAAFNSELDIWNLVYPILDTFDSRRPRPEGDPSNRHAETVEKISGYWQDAAVSRASVEKLLSLVRQARLEGLYDGSFRWRSHKYLPVGHQEYLQEGGSHRVCFLGDSPRPGLAATESMVLERVDWLASTPVQAALWILFATVFLAVGWPRSPLPRKESALTPSDTYSPRWPMTVARLAATLHFLFIAALAVLLASALRWRTPDLLHGISPAIYLVLVLPLLGGLCTLIALPGVGLAWRSANWTRRQQWSLTLLTLMLLLFLPFLRGWNLLGFHI